MMAKTWQQRQAENKKIREARDKRINAKRRRAEQRARDNAFRNLKR